MGIKDKQAFIQDESSINRSRSFSKSFKNLFLNNSSDPLSQQSGTISQKPEKYKAALSTKDHSLAQIVASNNADTLIISNDAKPKLKSDPFSSKSSSDNAISSLNSQEHQLSKESSVAPPFVAEMAPYLQTTLPATPTLLKKPNNDKESGYLIDEKLDFSKDFKPTNDMSNVSMTDEKIKRQPDFAVSVMTERSTSGRGRSGRRNLSKSRSRDASPIVTSREPSLSPQRSFHQYRSRGVSVSQANFSQPHSASASGSTNGQGQVKRSATMVKPLNSSESKGVMVNTRHMIWESETFKLYRNFTHEHKLSALPLIDINQDLLSDPEAMQELLASKNKEASSFSIGTLFKLHKTTQQTKEGSDDRSNQFFHGSKGYIPSKSELECNKQFNNATPHCKQVVNINSYCSTIKKKKNLNSGSSNENLDKITPTIVNPKAAISKDELHLINDLTTKMKSIISEKQTAKNKNTELKESDFAEKYGHCAGTLGQGAYGVVRVTCRRLKENSDLETKNNSPYVIDNVAKKSFRFKDSVFFAVKELQANKKNMRKNGYILDSDEESDESESESEISDENYSDNGNNDSLSSNGTTELFMKKINKHRKRKIKDYNAKFCTRLTSEFVIGHALNNVGRHPNILRIFDLYEYDNIDNKFLQVMEFCPSGDLHSLIKRISQFGNGRTVSRDVLLPSIANGPVFVGDNLNLMEGGTGFLQKENDQLNIASSNGSNQSASADVLSPTSTGNKLSGSQQSLLDSLIQRKQEKHNLLHPLEIDCYMKQLINGVSFMHQHGVAHCDLKPENILFKPNGILKISDFGTSCVFQTAWEKKPHYQTGCFGSEPYMAPEQFVAKNQYDPRLVDTFAVGVIYVTMAMGHYPWKSPVKEKDPDFAEFLDSLKVVIPYNAETKQQEIITGEYEPFEDMQHVNPEMKLLRKKCLYRMLHPNPNKRVLIKDVLNSNWMKRTHCCVIYKNSL